MSVPAYRVHRFGLVIAKLCLNLAILASIYFLIRFGYQLFNADYNSQPEAIKGASIMIGVIVGIVLLAKLSSHKLDNIQPSFKLTVLSLVGIALIFGFAGVEPISRYLQRIWITIDQWMEPIKVWAAIGALHAIFNPLYVIIFIAVVIWIIYTIRHG